MAFDYAARPPEVNSGLLRAGPGPGPLLGAAAGYTAIAQAADALAAATDAHVQAVMTTWRGVAADRAVLAFERHSVWLREIAALAETTAAKATAAANAYITAVASSPTLAELAMNRTTLATLIATNFLGINTIPIGVTEADYLRMWIQAAAAMYAYDAASTAITSSLSMAPPAPDITSPAPNLTSSLSGPLSSLTGALSSVTGPLSSVASTATADKQLASDRESAAERERELLASAAPAGFLGTAPGSSVLAELQGGGPSAAPISMTQGGFAAMPGTATGFLLPANWAMAAPAAPAAPGAPVGASAGSAFGAPAANAPGPAPVGAAPMGAAPMGAVAPATGTRPSVPETVSVPDGSQEVSTSTAAAVIDVAGDNEEV